MQVTFRSLVFALAAVGLAVGVAFGLGVAYGKGNAETVNTGLTQQQIQALVGGAGGQGGGGAGASGTPRAAGTATAPGGGAAAAGNNTTGQVTAVTRRVDYLTLRISISRLICSSPRPATPFGRRFDEVS